MMPPKTKTSKAPDVRARRKSLRLHGNIARDLGILIVSGRYQPGEVLNNEVAASDRLHVSRTAYREASQDGHTGECAGQVASSGSRCLVLDFRIRAG
jgi:hypothetical protein